MSQDRHNATNEEYCFESLPKNVRQVGETMQGTRFFIEDYVMTFLRKCMGDKKEEGIVLFVGKRGNKEAQNCIFIYGAIVAECNVLDGKRALDTQKWQEIYQAVQTYFPKGELFGFGCGVGMWNSQVDQSIQAMQKENFPMEDRLLFLADLGEKEEKLFVTKKEGLQELPGYWIYFSKNTQMQEYMLATSPHKSMEGGYQDDVTQNIREVIHRKKELHYNKRNVIYGISSLLFLLMLLGAFLLFQSTKRIRNLQQTIETLSHSTGDVVTGSAIADAKDTTTREESSNAKAGVNIKKSADPKKGQEEKKKSSQPEKETGIATREESSSPFFTPQGIKEDSGQTTKKSLEKIKKTKKEVAAGKSSKEKTTATAEPKKTGYRVKAGDTLSQIVWRQYHNLACIAMVRDVNHIKDDDKIQEGQFLLLPEYED